MTYQPLQSEDATLKTASKRLLLLTAILLAACGDQGREQPAVATVHEVYEDKSPLGCIGTDWNTLVRLEDGRVGRLCGRWGKPGDTIRGCWTSGATGDWAGTNGFHRICTAAASLSDQVGRTQ